MSEQAQRTKLLQSQFICPIWAVWFGKSVSLYFTSYHAGQMLQALRQSGTECACYDGKGNLAAPI